MAILLRMYGYIMTIMTMDPLQNAQIFKGLHLHTQENESKFTDTKIVVIDKNLVQGKVMLKLLFSHLLASHPNADKQSCSVWLQFTLCGIYSII